MTIPENLHPNRYDSPPGPENLRCYVREARLPWLITNNLTPRIPEDHKSHCNTLAVRQEPYRTLKYMHAFKDDIFEPYAAAWVDAYVPEHSLRIGNKDPETAETLSIECPKWFNIPDVHNYLGPAHHIASVQTWINCLPLATTQRVMHLSCPQTRDWRFDEDDDENDRDGRLFRHYLWTLPNNDPVQNLEVAKRSVVVAFQPPWILSPKDLESFADCRVFPPFRHGLTSLNSKERLWAKIWDLCVRKKSPWFILTSYNGWVFGAFSKGWTRAYVSSVFHSDGRSPTILECLLFWLASAMGLQGGWQIPEVGTETTTTLPELPCSVYDIMARNPVAARTLSVPEPVENVAAEFSIPLRTRIKTSVAPSEFSCEDQSDAGSSAGFNEMLSPRVSEYHLPGEPLLAPVNMPVAPSELQQIKTEVQTWRQSTVEAYCSFPVPGSPAMSALSFTSTSTIRDFSDLKGRKGNWLVGIQENEVVS